MNMKKLAEPDEPSVIMEASGLKRGKPWRPTSVRSRDCIQYVYVSDYLLQWEVASSLRSSATPQFDFPPHDLADALVDLFFTKETSVLPIIRRATFEGNRRANIHLLDDEFAKLFLMICALGARYSEDPRVCLPGEDGAPVRHSAGWKYFLQGMITTSTFAHKAYPQHRLTVNPGPLLGVISLFELQTMALSVLYLTGTHVLHHAWLVCSIAIRSAQDIGAHRSKVRLLRIFYDCGFPNTLS